MPCHLRNLPRRELGVDFLGQGLAFLLKPGNLFGNIDRRISLRQAQAFDIVFEVGNRMFKVEKTGFHQIQAYSETAPILTHRRMIGCFATQHPAKTNVHAAYSAFNQELNRRLPLACV